MIHVPMADFTLGDVLLTVLEIFLFVAWFWIFIAILGDLFSDHTMSGWGKAAWAIVLVVLPFLGAFIYLIARGGTMHERALQREANSRRQFETYVRQTAATASPADELAKLAELRDRGAISEAEFEQLKQRALSGGGAIAA
jgi:ABC-type transport system involved in cytochrome bd biosynthesis fused ATPase/permease subunit